MRHVVVEVQCERCARKETREYDPKVGETRPPPVFFGQLHLAGEKPQEVRFEDLCGPCTRSVKALLEQISKRIEGLSPDRVAKSKEPKDKPDSRAKEKQEAPTAPTTSPQPRQPAAKAPPSASRSS